MWIEIYPHSAYLNSEFLFDNYFEKNNYEFYHNSDRYIVPLFPLVFSHTLSYNIPQQK